MPSMKNRAHNLSRYVATLVASAIFLIAFAFAPSRAVAERIKVGVVKLANATYIALEKGYFAAEGLEVELVFFDVATPIAVGVVSGDLDFGATGLSAGFYNLAGQGALKIISGGSSIAPTFNDFAYVASNRAYAAGLKLVKDFPGHSVAISQFGTPVHYSLALLAEKYGLDLKSMRILPLQSNPNQVSALIGGSADAAVIPATYVLPAIQRGEVKLLGWVGDETPWQNGAVITATKTVNQRSDTVVRFLRAYRKAVRDYHDAFTGEDEKRKDGATAPAIFAILAKYTGQPVELIKLGIQYYDYDARLDVKDVLHQIAWYKSQGMLKEQVNGAELIDKRYVIALPER